MIDGSNRPDIGGREDIARLVTAFYRRAFADEMLGPIFVGIAKMDLEAHMPIMCDFWETMLFHAGLYRRNAFQPHVLLHAKVELTETHFERWLGIWESTVNEMFEGETADLAKLHSKRIANSIQHRFARQHAPEAISIQPRRLPVT